MKNSFAVAYAMKKKKAKGGMCMHGKTMCHECHGGEMAEGGEAETHEDEDKVAKSMKGAFSGPGHWANGGPVSDREMEKYKKAGPQARKDADRLKGVHLPEDPADKDFGRSEAGFHHAMSKHETSHDPGYRTASQEEHLKAAKEKHLEVLGRTMRMQKDDRKYLADGGYLEEEEASGYKHMPEERKPHERDAMREDRRKMGQHGEDEIAAQGMHEDNESHPEHMYDHKIENQDEDHDALDMVGKIMAKRQKHFSKGGRVANDEHPVADFEDNRFDDLGLDDDLEYSYTGKNSGDDIGNHEEDHDRHDIVARIMKSRKKKDRLPHPM